MGGLERPQIMGANKNYNPGWNKTNTTKQGISLTARYHSDHIIDSLKSWSFSIHGNASIFMAIEYITVISTPRKLIRVGNRW